VCGSGVRVLLIVSPDSRAIFARRQAEIIIALFNFAEPALSPNADKFKLPNHRQGARLSG